ncbi:hypothetical protein QBC34DRAFT_385669 [Podospora aff. communis PSN243]|uniref:Uncharacterized protein n=1 Tax=Podospora aff. communis PSN243 TaxID=3040156 RepID=A0AAV9G6D6_9PEZI|nr:hypothetical protein QBC34DRAFT_385669 [Podospora aff. communis PSN243]
MLLNFGIVRLDPETGPEEGGRRLFDIVRDSSHNNTVTSIKFKDDGSTHYLSPKQAERLSRIKEIHTTAMRTHEKGKNAGCKFTVLDEDDGFVYGAFDKDFFQKVRGRISTEIEWGDGPAVRRGERSQLTACWASSPSGGTQVVIAAFKQHLPESWCETTPRARVEAGIIGAEDDGVKAEDVIQVKAEDDEIKVEDYDSEDAEHDLEDADYWL